MSATREATKTRQMGFTYLWTLFFVAFLGISMTLTAELWSTAERRLKEKELLFIGNQFRDAIRRYYDATPGGAKQYPPTLDALLMDVRFPEPRKHLRKLYYDPITMKKEWGVIRIGGRIVGVHSLSREVPFKKSGFSLAESSFGGRERYSEWVFTYPPDLMLRAETPAMQKADGFGATSSVQLQQLQPVFDSSKEARIDMQGR